MQKRFMSIWFRCLKTDWLTRRNPALGKVAFVLVVPDHGRMIITATNSPAQKKGVQTGMVLADARAIIPDLKFFDDEPERAVKLLTALAEWCIRYTPSAAIDPPEALLLDITGCAHLWGGEACYLAEIQKQFLHFGYNTRIAIADTIGAAWAVARFGKDEMIIETGHQTSALLALPSAALRLDPLITERLDKLGLRQINSFISMPRTALRRRFGVQLLTRLDEAMGNQEETIEPVQPLVPYQERLPCLEPIVTATGIEIALKQLLNSICERLKKEEKGLRKAVLTCYRVDGKIAVIETGTLRPSCNSNHLFKLFEDKICSIEPALGIELFTLEAPVTEALSAVQEKLFEQVAGLDNIAVGELLDRLAIKIGASHIHRYVPAEHYWPERSFKEAASLNEIPETSWKTVRPRPIQLLAHPEQIEVTAPIPDYPPMLFRYKGKLHKVAKADGPERIEQEWWLQQGQHRDYYCVEDEEGYRYWLFRSGHYDVEKSYKWFIQGFFA